MKKEYILLICMCSCFFLLAARAHSQQLYLIQFKNKHKQSFNPTQYFDPHRLNRSQQQGLPVYDQRDLPVDQSYVDQLIPMVDSLRYTLRWFNGVSVMASPEQVQQIARLDFVSQVEAFGGISHVAATSQSFDVRSDTLLDMVRNQLELDSLTAHGLDGSGVRIAIFDVGFKEVPTHPSLRKLWKSRRILATRDFYGRDSRVYHHDIHGTQVLACMAGTYKGKQLGAAGGADYLLARTDHRLKEKPIEEDHWLAAMEWADKWGADIINSSVGFSRKRYNYADMDGKTTLVSRAARIAAEKGMLVVASNGNYGADKWKYLGAPADVKEVLSVGATYPMTPRKMPFSSYGPNAALQLKPDVAAPGFVIGPSKKGGMDEIAGTSYSAPLLAGVAACMIQMNPEAQPAELIRQFHKIGHFYPYFDYEMGHGIPKCGRLFTHVTREEKAPTFELFYRADTVILKLKDSVMQDSADRPFGPVLYVHHDNGKGQLLSALTVPLNNQDRYWYFIRPLGARGILRIWFEGYLYKEEWD